MEEIRLPRWVNEPYDRYRTALRDEEETAERLVTPEDVTLANNITDSLTESLSDDHTRVMRRADFQAIQEDTERMRNRDWVDRWHEHKASGEPNLINWHFVTVALVYAIFILAVVWLGAAWLDYFLGVSF